jgi:hypothetical protein
MNVNTKMSFVRLCIISFFCASSAINTAATAQPIPLKSCNGVYEFYGTPLATSGRGTDLRILFFIGERENILRCFKNSRIAISAPLYAQLDRGRYSKSDEQLLRTTAKKLKIKDPYIANAGI